MAKRKLTKEQKQAAVERLAEAREKRGHDGSTNVHPSVLALPEDHPRHWKKVKEWIRYNKSVLSEERKNLRRGVKGSEARVKSTEGYIRHLEAYLRNGDWLDNFYGQDQEKKTRWRCLAPAYHEDGNMKRTIGVWYPDIGTWTQELQDEIDG